MNTDLFAGILDAFNMAICVAYPIWRSYKVVESKKFDNELILWLSFWMISATVNKIEDFTYIILDFMIADSPPFSYSYKLLRMTFMAWLMHPKY